LRSLLWDYIEFQLKKQKEDPIKKAERNLIGKKIGIDFFPTPKDIVRIMIDKVDIQPREDILEPSAGKGDIAEEIKKKYPNNFLTVVEQNYELKKILELKGLDVVCEDFLNHVGSYDKIIMNPPFSKNADIDHVRHAYSLMKPGGKIVAIMSEHPFFAHDKKSEDFREWLEDKGFSVRLPEGSFKGRKAFNQTGVNSRLVEIKK